MNTAAVPQTRVVRRGPLHPQTTSLMAEYPMRHLTYHAASKTFTLRTIVTFPRPSADFEAISAVSLVCICLSFTFRVPAELQISSKKHAKGIKPRPIQAQLDPQYFKPCFARFMAMGELASGHSNIRCEVWKVRSADGTHMMNRTHEPGKNTVIFNNVQVVYPLASLVTSRIVRGSTLRYLLSHHTLHHTYLIFYNGV